MTPMYTTLQNLYIFPMSGNHAVFFHYISRYCRIGCNYIIRPNTHTFEYRAARANPHVTANIDRLWQVHYNTVVIENAMIVIIHYQDIPRQQAIIAEGDFFLRDNTCAARNCEVIA